MVQYHHPNSLGALQRYKQAAAIYKTTSRSTNPAWYLDPLELDYQWHIRYDGASCISYFHDVETGMWSNGILIPEAILNDPAQRKAFVQTTLRDAQLRVPKALGVIFYLANDFAINELKTDLDNPGSLQELRQTVFSNPLSLLEDSSVDVADNSFRLLPLPAAQETMATVVTHSRQLAPFLEDIRDASATTVHPVVAKAVSAPLVTLMGLPSLSSKLPDKPFVSILQYPWFTVLAFFNDRKDLMLVRTVQHRTGRRVGSLRAAITASCASLELIDPDVIVVPLGEQPDATIEQRLRTVLPTSQIQIISGSTAKSQLPAHCKEFGIAIAPPPAADQPQVSHTFETLRSEGWATQDFLPLPEEQAQVYPSRSEMTLLKALRRARLFIVILSVGFLGFQGKNLLDVIRQKEWQFDPSEAGITRKMVDKLNQEQQRIYHWNNLLEDRSRAWTTIELLAHLVDQKRGMLAKSFSHSAKPDTPAGQARVGFVKEWKITGLARDEALPFLNRLNTRDGLNAFFQELADKTGNRAFLPMNENRSLSVNLRILENSSFRVASLEQSIVTDESSYPFTFDLTISQRFESGDPMALNASKAP